MKPTIHDFGRIVGSIVIYITITAWFGFPNWYVLFGIPLAAFFFPIFNLGGEVEQIQAKGKITLDNVFDVAATLPGVPLALNDIGEGLAALLISIVLVIALVLLWKYRSPQGDDDGETVKS